MRTEDGRAPYLPDFPTCFYPDITPKAPPQDLTAGHPRVIMFTAPLPIPHRLLLCGYWTLAVLRHLLAVQELEQQKEHQEQLRG